MQNIIFLFRINEKAMLFLHFKIKNTITNASHY